MNRFATTFVRALAILATTSLAGCDEIEDIEDIDDVEDVDDIELRDGRMPIASIPWDYYPTKLSFSVPMHPAVEFKSKLTFDLHGPTDLAYIYTPSPTGDPFAILVDVNGVSPYSGNLTPVSEDVCDTFLVNHPYEVPISGSVTGCGAIEAGCCDYICYQWGGTTIEQNGANKPVAVTNETFYDPEFETDAEMMWGTFVESGRMTWELGQFNGGHSSRETVCGCDCTLPG